MANSSGWRLRLWSRDFIITMTWKVCASSVSKAGVRGLSSVCERTF